MQLVEVGLSFLEGIALIVSPCILPVLPLVLSASVEGGRSRPFGIILGFVLAFTAFALFSRKLVMWFGIDLDVIKYGSLIFLGAFGLVLISEYLSEKFSNLTQGIAGIGSNLSAQAQGGFLSGILIGSMIGLVWTPCAGPILAAILVQVIREQSDLNALILVGVFGLGVGVPMLIISLTGRKIMSKLSFFTTHAEGVRKTFGAIILAAVTFIATGIDPQSLFEGKVNMTESTAQGSGLYDALPEPYKAPEFKSIEAWLNSKPLTMASLKGEVVLIDFWTYSCINCIRTLPYITKWDRTYRDKGLVIIGVHSPEFEFEKDKSNVQSAIAKYHIEYPVALDNKLDTWVEFQNRYWPAHYLINKEGNVVYTHFGEGRYTETENNIRYLLGISGSGTQDEAKAPVTSRDQSPETYLGYERAENFVSPEKVVRNIDQLYTAPKFIPTDHWALTGSWEIGAQHITSAKAGSSIVYNFTAGKVFLVLGTKDGKPIKVKLMLNGEPIGSAAGKDAKNGIVTVDKHTLYELVNQGEAKNGLLEIIAESPGLEAYAFTFGL